MDAISNRLPVDKADLKSFFPKYVLCDQILAWLTSSRLRG